MTSKQTILIIDADNQPVHILAELAAYLRVTHPRISRAYIGGNGSGQHVASWTKAVRTSLPSAEIVSYVAPVRKQAADAWLVMQTGALCGRYRTEELQFIIVSRDDLFTATAEHLVSEGFDATLAVLQTNTPPQSTVPVVLLSAGDVAHEVVLSDIKINDPASFLDFLRRSTGCNTSRFAASVVGAALCSLGLNKEQRARFLRQHSWIKSLGSGHNKAYAIDF